MKNNRKTLVGILALMLPLCANAEIWLQDQAYVGVGLNSNSADIAGGNGNADGVQLIAGYRIPYKLFNNIDFSSEVGFLNSGDFSWDLNRNGIARTVEADSADSLWAAAIIQYQMPAHFHFLGRLGVDFGDDDGLIYGVGGGYDFARHYTLRAEYVSRDVIDSIQFNVLYNF